MAQGPVNPQFPLPWQSPWRIIAIGSLKTIAEYVATEGILQRVMDIGIDYAQGYFVGRPQPLRQLADDARRHDTQEA